MIGQPATDGDRLVDVVAFADAAETSAIAAQISSSSLDQSKNHRRPSTFFGVNHDETVSEVVRSGAAEPAAIHGRN